MTFIDITSDYSMGLAQSFASTFKHLGSDILEKLHYKRRHPNYRELVSLAAQLKPDVLFIPRHDESALFLKEAQRLGLKVVLMGADGWDLKSFINMGGDQIEQGFFSTHWSEEIDNDFSRSFVAKYKKHDPIFSPEALGYDAVYLLADAIKRAGVPERIAIHNALSQTHSFQGTTGSLSLDSTGDPLKKCCDNGIKKCYSSLPSTDSASTRCY